MINTKTMNIMIDITMTNMIIMKYIMTITKYMKQLEKMQTIDINLTRKPVEDQEKEIMMKKYYNKLEENNSNNQ